MESNSTKCKKFSANIFNKSKCQNCFRPKEQHSAEALESSKVLRKVSKCGYLFVAPESFDFNNPMDKTRRWQRRFFVLYDDGELTYSVDENVGTVPQGVIDMNKCNDVHDAETVTSHPLAIAVHTPEKTTFIKGSDKHEIERWFDVLVMYPRSLKTKHRRSPTYPTNLRQPAAPAQSPTQPPPEGDSGTKQPAPVPDPPPAGRRPASQSLVSGALPVARPTNLLGTSLPPRRHTYTHPPTWTPDEDEDPECLTSMADVSLPLDVFHTDSSLSGGTGTDQQQEIRGDSAASGSFSHSRTDPRMADQGSSAAAAAPSPQRSVLENVPATFRSVRRMKQRDRAYQEGMHRDRSAVYQDGMRKSNSMHDLSRADADSEPTDPPLYRSRSRDALYPSPPQTRPDSSPGPAGIRASPRSVSAPAGPKVSTETPRTSRGVALDVYGSRDTGTPAYIVNGRTKNETDEHKMAKSGELAARIGHHLATDVGTKQRHDPYDDLMYMKKGWLLKQHQDQDWSKHWFVLSGSSLRFYKDSRAEETSDEDGCIDIASCYEVGDTNVSRNYGFKLKTSQGDHILSAMTSGIRNNWLQAIQKCMETSGPATPHLDFSPAHRDYSPSSRDYSTTTHHDYSPSSSSNHNSSFTSWSTTRHSEYPNSQREGTSRRHNNVNAPASRGMFTSDSTALASQSASPRGDHLETAWSRPSRARRSLDASAFAGGGDGQKTPLTGSQHVPPQSAAARFVSCTWPYDSSSSGASGSEREHTPDSSSHGSRSRRNSNVSQYLEDEDEVRAHDRTAEEEQELDDVEHNIRQIHRRSLSDHSSRQRPLHFDKFESGTAFDANDQPGMDRSGSGTASSRRHPPKEHSTPVRAPSAKVKEKSRARSPRPRSPPPLEVKARDVPLEDTRSLREVESLKNQLERTRTELTDSKHENHTLKLQLRSNNRDQDDLITDLETDKTRYLTQIEDIQDQMEHTTDFLQQRLVEQEAKLAEQESHADLTKLQVQTLKKHLKEAKEKMEAQESQLKIVQSKLKSDSWGQSLRDANTQKEHFESLCEELKRKLKLLEEEVEQLESQLSQKTQQLNQQEKHLQSVQEALEHSEQHLLDLEHDLEEVHTLRMEVKVREEKMADLDEELSAVRSQLSEQDQELAVKDDIHQAETLHLQETLALERRKLEDHLEGLEKQLEMTRRQSTMSDSLNSNMADILREKDETIAQLEEKLIENDSKIEELTEEVALEMEENTQLQLNLEASYGETAHGKRDMEQLNGEVSQMEKALEAARHEVDELKRVEEKQQEIIEEAREEELTLKEQVSALQRENSELRHLLEELKLAQDDSQQLADLTQEVEEHKCQNDAFKEECAKLEREVGVANEKVTQYESEISELKRQYESELEQRSIELVEARQTTDQLQTQLGLAEEVMMKNKQHLEENMAAMQTVDKPPAEKQDQQLEKDYEDMKTKYERSMQEVRRLRNELREAHISIDDMEIASTGVQQRVKIMEADYQQQLVLMSSRVQDLTTKLATADKKVRKLERRASRRESKLKLRRDSLEYGEKTSGSSGEAEHERESDIRAPDQEVMDLLKAVVGASPGQLESAQTVPVVNASLGNDDSQLEDSINSEVSDPAVGQQEVELVARCRQLQDGLVSSEAKVKELSKALDLTTPEGQNKELHEVQEQNKKYEQQIIFLTAKLNKSSASASVETAKAKRAAGRDEQGSKPSKEEECVASHQVGLESQFGHTQSTLEEMQQKLTDVVDELGSMSTTQSTADYTATISGLRSRLETILTEISSTAGEGKIIPRSSLTLSAGMNLKVDDPMRMFAEKLSLEAMLVGEMAHLIRNSQEPIASERQVYLREISEANHRILELEQKIQLLQLHDSGKGEISDEIGTGDLVLQHSGLLADKMALQSHMQVLLEKYKDQVNIKSTLEKSAGEGAMLSMGQEALLKSQLAERLQGQKPVSLSSHVLVQGEFTFIMNKLRERMSDSRTDQERINLMDHELELSHQRLCERANLMCDGVEAYKISALDKVAATIVNNKASKTSVDTQMARMIQKCAAEYRKLSVDTESLSVMSENVPENRRHAMIEASIQQEVEEAIEVLGERCEATVTGEGIGGEEELNAVLESVCEVLAQKAVIDGHIAYITEQIQQHQQQEGTDRPAPNPLRRHDSGIIVGGSSMPTSPTVEEASPISSMDGDMTTLAGRLAREANAKRQLALSLQLKDGTQDSVQTQMVKIAADLVNVDVRLVQHRRLITDYAEVIAQEAMFQAQMTYLTEQLRMQHEQQIAQLQRQLDTRSPGIDAADDDQEVQVLEAEIQRLSDLLRHNDELLQREAANAGERMGQLEEELQRQEDFFHTEVATLEQRYKDKLKVTETDLHETQEELEKLRVSSQKEAFAHTKRVENLEKQLEEALKALAEAQSDKSGTWSTLEKRVQDTEGKLRVAYRDMEVAERKHSQQLEVYSTKVASLEAQIVTLSEKHMKQLAQAQQDLQAAVVATGAEGLQQEVARLRARLEEERAEHQRQLVALRQEPGGADGASGEATTEGALSAKVRHLEWQIESMQADYERELTVQRAAHRRELTRSKEDLLGLLAQAEAKSMQIDEHTIRKRYTKEIEHIKEIYDCGFAAMEKSHQRVLREMRAAHKRDLEILRTEKDQLLIEETKATQAALDAMRKAHEAEVQKERNKFLDAISKTYSNNDVDSIQRQHEEDLELIQNEIHQLSEQLSIKCLENAALDERLTVQTTALAETRSRAHELMARNEELSLRLRQDIERLSKMIKHPAAPGSPFRRQGEPPELYDLRVALKVKDVDKQHLEEEVAALRSQLHGTTEELEDSMERFQELHSEKTRMRTGYEDQLHKLRSRLDDIMDEPESSSDGALSERDRASGGSPVITALEDQHTDTDTMTPESSNDGDDFPQFASPRLMPSTGRTLPQVSNEARNAKRYLWRQRHVQRARSTPGPAAMFRRLSLPVEQSQSSAKYSLQMEEVATSSPVTASGGRSRKERSSRHTTVGVNVAEQVFTEKL